MLYLMSYIAGGTLQLGRRNNSRICKCRHLS